MNNTARSDSRTGSASRVRYWRIALLAVALVVINLGAGWFATQLNLQVWPRHNDMIEMIMIVIFLGYVVTMMLPFVPGIEIGMAIMLMLGQGGVVAVYLCTQIALALSFMIGRYIPIRFIHAVFRQLRLERVSRLLEELDRPDPYQRVRRIATRTRYRWVAALLQNRYLALAVALNLPGNAVIGGAGGIGAAAGLSRVFALPRFLLVVALATLPVPVFILFTEASW